jgi:alpha-tubulin suppressor-like RCC1 family protein
MSKTLCLGGEQLRQTMLTFAMTLCLLLLLCAAAFGQHAILAWGEGLYERLGDGTDTDHNVPIVIKKGPGSGTWGFLDAIAIDGGGRNSLAIRDGGTLWEWGRIGNSDGPNVPTQVTTDGSTAFTGAIAISAGYEHNLVVKSDNTVWAWGMNFYGQMGTGTTMSMSNTVLPQQVKINNTPTYLTSVTAVSAGGSHSLALKSDETVWAWGSNSNKQLGTGLTGMPPYKGYAEQVKGSGGSGYLTDIVAIAAGDSHSLALEDDGTVWAWGGNGSGQVGNGNTTDQTYPVSVLSGAIAIAAGGSHSLALKSDGTVWAWGLNDKGQLGDNTTTNRTSPVQVILTPGMPNTYLTSITAIAAGGAHSLALKSDDSVWAWGRNDEGQLGDGTTTSRSLPVQADGAGESATLLYVEGLAAGAYHSLALQTTVHITGTLDMGLLGCGSCDCTKQVTFRFCDDDVDGLDVAFDKVVTVDESSGAFDIIVPRLRYDYVYITSPGFLAKLLSDKDARTGNVSLGTIELLGGDATGMGGVPDNSVDVLDLDALIAAFDACDGDPAYDAAADFNCDGCVDVLDLDILMANFDMAGDSAPMNCDP